MPTGNFDLSNCFGTETIVVGHSAPPALPLTTPLHFILSNLLSINEIELMKGEEVESWMYPKSCAQDCISEVIS